MPTIKHIDFQVPGWGEFQQPPTQRMGYRGEVMADSPLMYLRMGESSGTIAYDETGQHDAAVEGSLVWGIPGALCIDSDTAASGAGTGSLLVSETGWLPIGSAPRTIELWFKPNTLTSVLKGITYGGTLDGTRLMLSYTQSELSVYVTSCYFGVQGLSLSGQWHHAALVFPSGATRCDEFLFYLDGQQLSPGVIFGSGSASISTSDSGLLINKLAGGGANDCDFDEVAIYGSALSSQRILDHYLAGAVTEA